MKKIIAFLMCLLIFAFCFTGCYSSYRIGEKYKNFAQSHKAGMTKQKVYNKFGCPEAYQDSEGKGHSAEKEADFETKIFSSESVRWFYRCDAEEASGSFHLYVEFDAEGKSTKAHYWTVS